MTRSLFLAAVSSLALSAAAFAADLPTTKGEPVYAPPPPAVFSWTGLYAGGQVGYQWGNSSDPYIFDEADPALTEPLPLAHSDSGIVGGAHLGYNWQIYQFVLGAEGDVDGASYHGSAADAAPPPYSYSESTRIPIEGSIRGRVGVAFDRFLIYGTGGVEFASVRSSFGITDTLGGITQSFFATNGRVGWTAGGGAEYAIDNNWSVRAEYRYIDLGRVNYSLDPVSMSTTGYSKRVTANQVTAGFSYKFDFAPPPVPVVAKY